MMIDEDHKTKGFFAIESQSDESSAIAIDQSSTRRYIFPYILPLFNVYRYVNNCASQEMQIYAAQPIIFSARFVHCVNICIIARDYSAAPGQYKTWTADYGLRTTDWV